MARKQATELLKEKIEALEVKQAEEAKAFRDEVKEAYESLKPVNLIKSSLAEFVSADDLKKELFESGILLVNSIITTQLTKKQSDNYFIRTLSTFAQLAITTLLTRNREGITQWISSFIDKLFASQKEKS